MSTGQDLDDLRSELIDRNPGFEIRNQIAELRLAGQDASLQIEIDGDPGASFRQKFQGLFGYPPPADKVIELVSLRVIASKPAPPVRRETFADTDAVAALQHPRRRQWVACPSWRPRQPTAITDPPAGFGATCWGGDRSRTLPPPLRRDRRRDGHPAPAHRRLDQYQGARGFFLCSIRCPRNAGDECPAHPGSPRCPRGLRAGEHCPTPPRPR